MNILILIIGANNIANYALIKYFKEKREGGIPKYDKVMFIYSNFSEKFVDNFKQLLDDIKIIDVLLENEDDLSYVENRVLKELNRLRLNSIHLNYTGGRKPMSIGAFLAVDKYEKCEDKIFSDISPKDYKLRLRRGDIYPKIGSLSDGIELNIEEFFILHGNDKPFYEKRESEFYNIEFVKFLIKQAIDNEEEFYKNMWDKDLKSIKKENWIDTIKNAPLTFNPKEISNKKLKKLRDFIRGRFLEEYIFDILMRMKDELNLSDIGWNVKNGKDSKFEVDIIAIKGYKSFTFSCTTAYKKEIIKSKLFEAQYRAEQIGGIKNMPISISFANRNTIIELENDLTYRLDKASAQFIGIDDIMNEILLRQRLKNIFEK